MPTSSYFDGLVADPILHILRQARVFGGDDVFISRLLHPSNPITGANHLLFSSSTLRVLHPIRLTSIPINTHLNEM